MSGRDGHDSHDPLAALNLPQSIHTQALKLLGIIEQARTKTEAWRAADRAEGFGLGVETVKALNPASLEGLYMAFEDALQRRLAELEK